MSSAIVKSIKENKKRQKDLILNHLIAKFSKEDRLLIAKLMQQEYREGFLNGMKINNQV
jgi:hypothetical protein